MDRGYRIIEIKNISIVNGFVITKMNSNRESKLDYYISKLIVHKTILALVLINNSFDLLNINWNIVYKLWGLTIVCRECISSFHNYLFALDNPLSSDKLALVLYFKLCYYRKTLCLVPPLSSLPHEIGKISVVDKIWYKFRLFLFE